MRAAAELRIAEHLVDGPKTAAELAALTSTQERALGQLLRGLCALACLRGANDGSVRHHADGSAPRRGRALLHSESWTLHWGGSLWGPWGRLPETVRTGESGRFLESGTRDFEHLVG